MVFLSVRCEGVGGILVGVRLEYGVDMMVRICCGLWNGLWLCWVSMLLRISMLFMC